MDIYELAEEFALQTNKCIFLTGKAGSGKTTFLKHLRQTTKREMAVAAPTGVAAINAGGVTLNSMFQIPPEIFLPTPQHEKALIASQRMRSAKRKVLYNLEVLVIDEVSMVRADMLDAVDTVLRHYRSSNEPFGGVQVILIGDLYQLSPVVRDADVPLLREFYAGPYFFQSRVMQRLQPIYIELDKIFRQQNQQFVDLLNQVRNNCLSAENLKLLNERYRADFKPKKEDFYITLTTHNARADKINAEELDQLKGLEYQYHARVQGEFPENNYPTEELLTLKKGARVMFVKNDESPEKRYFNGKLGVVFDFDEEADTVWVQCEGEPYPIEVGSVVWRNIRYTLNDKTKELQEKVLGNFEQVPLRLAWAITIHKSQGLTFDRCVIDAGSAFAAGQVYVALSRCRSLEGIVLLSRISSSGLFNAQEVLQHEKDKKSVEELMKYIQPAKREFRLQVLSSVFDFSIVMGQVSRLSEYIKKNSAEFEHASNSVDYLQRLASQLALLTKVGGQFRIELRQLIEAGNEEQLRTRMQAAYGYFEPQFRQVLTDLESSPLTTDVKKSAEEVNEVTEAVNQTLQQHLHLMNSVTQDPTVASYYRAKKHFTVQKLKTTAYAGAKITEATGDVDPDLYKLLQAWRNKRRGNKAAFTVASNAALEMVASEMPRTKAALLRLKGWGKVKVEAYGDEILAIIQAYFETR